MINMIKAELYRVTKGKTIWITGIILILFVVFTVASETIGTSGVDVGETANQLASMESAWTGYQAAFTIMSMTNFLQYFFLPILIVIIGTDFSNLVCKNSITKGITRTKYYLSKLVVTYFICTILALIYLLCGILTATVLNGFHGAFSLIYVKDILTIFIPQLLILFALASIAAAVLVISKKVVASTVAYIVVPLIIQIIFYFITQAAPGIGDTLVYFELFSSISNIGMNAFTSNELLAFSGISIAYVVISTTIGVYLFKKSDIG